MGVCAPHRSVYDSLCWLYGQTAYVVFAIRDAGLFHAGYEPKTSDAHSGSWSIIDRCLARSRLECSSEKGGIESAGLPNKRNVRLEIAHLVSGVPAPTTSSLGHGKTAE